MQLSEFLNLKLGTVIFNKKDADIRRVASGFLPDRVDQYQADGVVMWTRALYDRTGNGRDIALAECGDWEVLPNEYWKVEDQRVINRVVIEQQDYIIDRLDRLQHTLRSF